MKQVQPVGSERAAWDAAARPLLTETFDSTPGGHAVEVSLAQDDGTARLRSTTE